MQLFGRDKEPLKAVCAGMGFIYSGKAQLTKQFLQLWGSYVDPFIRQVRLMTLALQHVNLSKRGWRDCRCTFSLHASR